MIVARTIAEARATLEALPRPLGLVPTMGALHEGHLALVRAARARCASVVASLFVNPTQFGASEDFARYPRDEARDLDLFAETGVDVVFAPTAAEMYPTGFATSIHVTGPLTDTYEGAGRPGHFDGVATVVVKLLDIVRPDVAFFGQKDAQQLALVRRVVRDLDLPVEVAGVATVREPDGLAMSSRNAYLTREERAVAPDLYRALLAGRAAARTPGGTPTDAITAATLALTLPDRAPVSEPHVTPARYDGRRREPGAATRPRLHIEYLDVVDAATFARERELTPHSLLIACARLGATRLLDNVSLAPVPSGSMHGARVSARAAGAHGPATATASTGDPPCVVTTTAKGAYPERDATH